MFPRERFQRGVRLNGNGIAVYFNSDSTRHNHCFTARGYSINSSGEYGSSIPISRGV